MTHVGPTSSPCPLLVRLARLPPKWFARWGLPKRPCSIHASRTTRFLEPERLTIASVDKGDRNHLAARSRWHWNVPRPDGFSLCPPSSFPTGRTLRVTPSHLLHDRSRFALVIWPSPSRLTHHSQAPRPVTMPLPTSVADRNPLRAIGEPIALPKHAFRLAPCRSLATRRSRNPATRRSRLGLRYVENPWRPEPIRVLSAIMRAPDRASPLSTFVGLSTPDGGGLRRANALLCPLPRFFEMPKHPDSP